MRNLTLSYTTDQRDAQILHLASHGYPFQTLESHVHDLLQAEFGDESSIEGVVKNKDGTFNALVDGVFYRITME